MASVGTALCMVQFYLLPSPPGSPGDKSSPSGPGVGNCLKRSCPGGRERGKSKITSCCSRKGPVIRATFSYNLSCNNVAVASWDCLLRVLPPSRATNFHVAESRCRFYFLQHKNLLREMVVIRATNNLNLQRNIVARQVARECCPYYWALKYVTTQLILWPRTARRRLPISGENL